MRHILKFQLDGNASCIYDLVSRRGRRVACREAVSHNNCYCEVREGGGYLSLLLNDMLIGPHGRRVLINQPPSQTIVSPSVSSVKSACWCWLLVTGRDFFGQRGIEMNCPRVKHVKEFFLFKQKGRLLHCLEVLLKHVIIFLWQMIHSGKYWRKMFWRILKTSQTVLDCQSRKLYSRFMLISSIRIIYQTSNSYLLRQMNSNFQRSFWDVTSSLKITSTAKFFRTLGGVTTQACIQPDQTCFQHSLLNCDSPPSLSLTEGSGMLRGFWSLEVARPTLQSHT